MSLTDRAIHEPDSASPVRRLRLNAENVGEVGLRADAPTVTAEPSRPGSDTGLAESGSAVMLRLPRVVRGALSGADGKEQGSVCPGSERRQERSPQPRGGRSLEIAAMFGLGADETREVEIVPPFDLTLHGGEIVFITGPSGGGKSTILNAIEAALHKRERRAAGSNDPMPERYALGGWGRSDARSDAPSGFAPCLPIPDPSDPPVRCECMRFDALLALDNENHDRADQGAVTVREQGNGMKHQPSTPAPSRSRLLGNRYIANDESSVGRTFPWSLIGRWAFNSSDGRDGRPTGDISDRPLIDLVGRDTEDAARVLSLAGLADAFVMLRRASELSDGQRFRFALARLIGGVDGWGRSDAPSHPNVIAPSLLVVLVDEFAATLDRVTARTVARNLRRWMRSSPAARRLCFVAATTHDDLLEALRPDVLIHKPDGPRVEVVRLAEHADSRSRPPQTDKGAGDLDDAPTSDSPSLTIAAPSRSREGVHPPSSDGLKAHLPADDGRDAHPTNANDPDFTFERGTMADYAALAAHHYKDKASTSTRIPATAVFVARCCEPSLTARFRALWDSTSRDRERAGDRVGCPSHVPRSLTVAALCRDRLEAHPPEGGTMEALPSGEDARDTQSAEAPAAVLVVGWPRPACALRDVATGGRYVGLDPGARATLINREVRAIHRVIVEPRFRGIGLAVRLVCFALAHAETAYMEAIAAMGRVNPFFERAGMTRYDGPPRAEDARLLDALREIGWSPVDLAPSASARARLDALPAATRAWLERELRTWRCHRFFLPRNRRDELALDDCLAAARQRLLARAAYYLHRRPLECVDREDARDAKGCEQVSG